METKTDFWNLARAAERLGLITKRQALTIVRPGTRKQNYWARHCRDLMSLIEQRIQEGKQNA